MFPFRCHGECSYSLTLRLFSSTYPNVSSPSHPYLKSLVQTFKALLIIIVRLYLEVVEDEDPSKSMVFCMIGLSVEYTCEHI